MDPFEAPPTSPPVSLDPPSDPPAPRRGRMALVALASAGLLAGGVVGVSALVSADDPELGSSDVAAVADGVAADDEPADGGDGEGYPTIDGEIVIDIVEEFRECAGLPMWPDEVSALDLGEFDGEFGELFDGEFAELFEQFEAMLDEFGLAEDGVLGEGPVFGGPGVFGDGHGGGEVTVLGPDGVTVIDLGDGDGSVTISRDGDTGELTITTSGTASEQSLDELLDELLGDVEFDLGEFEFGELPEGLDDLLSELPDLGEFEFEFGDGGTVFDMPVFEEIDPERIADCLADLG